MYEIELYHLPETDTPHVLKIKYPSRKDFTYHSYQIDNPNNLQTLTENQFPAIKDKLNDNTKVDKIFIATKTEEQGKKKPQKAITDDARKQLVEILKNKFGDVAKAAQEKIDSDTSSNAAAIQIKNEKGRNTKQEDSYCVAQLNIPEDDLKLLSQQDVEDALVEAGKLIQLECGNHKSGSTLAIGTVINNRLYSMSLGDSYVKKVTQNDAGNICEPVNTYLHSANNPKELSRKKDGKPINIVDVTHNAGKAEKRLAQILLVTGAIGDIQYRKDGLEVDPKIESVDITEKDKIVVATDGLEVTDIDIAEIVQFDDNAESAKKLALKAKKNKTADDVTIVVADPTQGLVIGAFDGHGHGQNAIDDNPKVISQALADKSPGIIQLCLKRRIELIKQQQQTLSASSSSSSTSSASSTSSTATKTTIAPKPKNKYKKPTIHLRQITANFFTVDFPANSHSEKPTRKTYVSIGRNQYYEISVNEQNGEVVILGDIKNNYNQFATKNHRQIKPLKKITYLCNNTAEAIRNTITDKLPKIFGITNQTQTPLIRPDNPPIARFVEGNINPENYSKLCSDKKLPLENTFFIFSSYTQQDSNLFKTEKGGQRHEEAARKFSEALNVPSIGLPTLKSPFTSQEDFEEMVEESIRTLYRMKGYEPHRGPILPAREVQNPTNPNNYLKITSNNITKYYEPRFSRAMDEKLKKKYIKALQDYFNFLDNNCNINDCPIKYRQYYQEGQYQNTLPFSERHPIYLTPEQKKHYQPNTDPKLTQPASAPIDDFLVTLEISRDIYNDISLFLTEVREAYLNQNNKDLSCLGLRLRHQLYEMGFNKDNINSLTEETLIRALLRTKEPCVFAEQLLGDGRQWTRRETSLLGYIHSTFFDDVEAGADKTLRDDGKAFTPENRPKVNLVMTAGGLYADKNPADVESITDTHGQFDLIKYKADFKKRYLHLLLQANDDAQNNNEEIVFGFPTFSGGMFGGRFSGDIKRHFRNTLEELIKENLDNLRQVKGIIYDKYSEYDTTEQHDSTISDPAKQHQIRLIVSSSAKNSSDTVNRNQANLTGFKNRLDIQKSSVLSEIKGFENYKRVVFVAGDGNAYYGNDFYIKSPSTQEGGIASIVNIVGIITKTKHVFNKVKGYWESLIHPDENPSVTAKKKSIRIDAGRIRIRNNDNTVEIKECTSNCTRDQSSRRPEAQKIDHEYIPYNEETLHKIGATPDEIRAQQLLTILIKIIDIANNGTETSEALIKDYNQKKNTQEKLNYLIPLHQKKRKNLPNLYHQACEELEKNSKLFLRKNKPEDVIKHRKNIRTGQFENFKNRIENAYPGKEIISKPLLEAMEAGIITPPDSTQNYTVFLDDAIDNNYTELSRPLGTNEDHTKPYLLSNSDRLKNKARNITAQEWLKEQKNADHNKTVSIMNLANANHVSGGAWRKNKAQEEALFESGDVFLRIAEQYPHGVADQNGSDLLNYTYVVQGCRQYYEGEYGELERTPTQDILSYEYQMSVVAGVDFGTENGLNKNIERMKSANARQEFMRYTRYVIRRVCEDMLKNNPNGILGAGALGCGVFNNNPFLIAAIYRSVLCEERYKNLNVEFPIADTTLSTIFNEVFSCSQEELDLILNSASIYKYGFEYNNTKFSSNLPNQGFKTTLKQYVQQLKIEKALGSGHILYKINSRVQGQDLQESELPDVNDAKFFEKNPVAKKHFNDILKNIPQATKFNPGVDITFIWQKFKQCQTDQEKLDFLEKMSFYSQLGKKGYGFSPALIDELLKTNVAEKDIHLKLLTPELAYYFTKIQPDRFDITAILTDKPYRELIEKIVIATKNSKQEFILDPRALIKDRNLIPELVQSKFLTDLTNTSDEIKTAINYLHALEVRVNPKILINLKNPTRINIINLLQSKNILDKDLANLLATTTDESIFKLIKILSLLNLDTQVLNRSLHNLFISQPKSASLLLLPLSLKASRKLAAQQDENISDSTKKLAPECITGEEDEAALKELISFLNTHQTYPLYLAPVAKPENNKAPRLADLMQNCYLIEKLKHSKNIDVNNIRYAFPEKLRLSTHNDDVKNNTDVRDFVNNQLNEIRHNRALNIRVLLTEVLSKSNDLFQDLAKNKIPHDGVKEIHEILECPTDVTKKWDNTKDPFPFFEKVQTKCQHRSYGIGGIRRWYSFSHNLNSGIKGRKHYVDIYYLAVANLGLLCKYSIYQITHFDQLINAQAKLSFVTDYIDAELKRFGNAKDALIKINALKALKEAILADIKNIDTSLNDLLTSLETKIVVEDKVRQSIHLIDQGQFQPEKQKAVLTVQVNSTDSPASLLNILHYNRHSKNIETQSVKIESARNFDKIKHLLTAAKHDCIDATKTPSVVPGNTTQNQFQ